MGETADPKVEGNKGANAGDGGAAPPPQKVDPPKPDPAKAFTQDDLDRVAGERAKRAEEATRTKLLGRFKEFGVESEEALVNILKANKDAEDARKSDLEKATSKAAKLEAELAQHKAEAAAAREEARRVRMYAEAGVTDTIAVDAHLNAAKAADKDLDEKKWLAKLKEARPHFFGGAAPGSPPGPPANTGRPAPPGSHGGGNPPPFDARTADPKDLRAKAIAAGLDPNLFRG